MLEYLGARAIVEVLEGGRAHELAFEQCEVVGETHRETAHTTGEIGLITETQVHQFVLRILTGMSGIDIEVEGVVLIEQVVQVQLTQSVVGAVV